MACDRSGCTSILCDTYISGVGYVCSSCQGEFEDYCESENIDASTEGKITKSLKKFMDTEKNSYTDEEMTVSEFFNKHSR